MDISLIQEDGRHLVHMLPSIPILPSFVPDPSVLLQKSKGIRVGLHDNISVFFFFWFCFLVQWTYHSHGSLSRLPSPISRMLCSELTSPVPVSGATIAQVQASETSDAGSQDTGKGKGMGNYGYCSSSRLGCPP